MTSGFQETTLPRDANQQPIQGVFRTIADGTKSVTTGGTAVPLATSSTPCKRLDVTAKYGNTDMVVIGASTVVALAANRRGVPLTPGQTYTFFPTDLIDVYIDSVVNGEGVTFTYFV